MEPCVLVIAQERLLPEEELAAHARALGNLRWERCVIGDGLPEPLLPGRQRLLLLEAGRSPEGAQRLLRWYLDTKAPVPALGLLPEELGDEVLRSASRALDDFVVWPARRGEVRQRAARLLGVGRATSSRAAEARLAEELGLRNLVGQSPAFLAMVEQLPRIARSEGSVLLAGETGTGKELCARAIHHLGPRRHGPFIAVDCGALPESVFENELFGHAAGAYTDARAEQRGLAALAEGGTLFLDEVDNLAPSAQAKLLRFLQERAYRPLGSERFRQANVRVIAASNRDLRPRVAAGAFRQDLYFRLNVLFLRLAPLRERTEDIPLLAQHFLVRAVEGEAPAGRPRAFAESALRKLQLHEWPGNVRELQNAVERAVALGGGPIVRPEDLAFAGPGDPDLAPEGFRSARAAALERFERTYVQELLRRHAGNITHAAREAQKDRRVFGRLVKRLGLRMGGSAPPPSAPPLQGASGGAG